MTKVPEKFLSGALSRIYLIFIRNLRPVSYTQPGMTIDGPLKIEREEGKKAGTRILRLSGPLTLRNIFDFQAQLRNEEPVAVTILDLSGVPYMDSAGMGLVINYHVHCQNKGVQLIATGVSPRIMELFKMTRVDSVIRIAGTAEEAEAIA